MTIHPVIAAAAKSYNVKPAALVKKPGERNSCFNEVAKARHDAIFVLTKSAGKSALETGRLLGISESSVRSALDSLRVNMNPMRSQRIMLIRQRAAKLQQKNANAEKED